VSQPNSPDVFVVRPNLELFSISSRTPFPELSAADRADQAGSRTLTAKVQLPQEVPPEPPPLKLCSFLALPSPCVLFSSLDFVSPEPMQIGSSSENNMKLENSTTDPLFCEPFVAAPTEIVGAFFDLQHNMDFTAAVKSASFVQTDLTMYVVKPCINTYDSVFSQPSDFLVSNESQLVCCLVPTVGLTARCKISKFVDVSLNNSWITDMCSLFRDGGGKASERCFLSCALGAVSCSTAPNRLFPLGTVFRDVRRDFLCSPLQCAVNSDRLPCALASCRDAAQPS